MEFRFRFQDTSKRKTVSISGLHYSINSNTELFAYFVQGGCGQVLGNAHGNVYFGVANGTACTMHLLAWDDPGDKKMLTTQ